MSSGTIDLRPPRAGKKRPRESQWYFLQRPPREPRERDREGESLKRPLPLRARRRRARVLSAFAVLLVIAAAGYGISWASYLPQFSINEVSVLGTEHISAQLVQSYVATILDDGSYHIFSRKNVFIYPRSVIEKAIEDYFPRIKSAKVSRDSLLATVVTITVIERQPFALWCTGGEKQCSVMDESGFIFAEAPSAASASSTTEYTFQGGLSGQDIATSSEPIGQTFVRAHLPGLIALLQLLGQAGFNPRGAIVDGGQDFSIPFREGFMMKASFGEDAGMLSKNLQLVLSSDALRGKENELEYIDLRFGNKVYYKLKGEAQAQAGQ